MSDESKPPPSSQDSLSDSPSPDASASVGSLTRALDGILREITASREAQVTFAKAVMQLGSRVGKMDDALSEFVGKADGLIVAGKLSVDVAARETAALERTRARLEETGQRLLLKTTPQPSAPLPLRYRVLDFCWPYAAVSARHVVTWVGAAFGAGGGIALAWQAIVTWAHR